MAKRKNAGDSGSSILTLGLLAVGGYFVYEWLFTPATTTTAATTTTPVATPTTASSVSTPVATTSTTPAATTTPASGSTLDSIYAAMLAGIDGDPNFTGSGSSITGTAYHFLVYLQLAAPGYAMPDPGVVFQNATQADQMMTAAAFWAAMAPALQAANPGLSGLGCYAGSGAYLSGLGAYAW